MRQAALITVTVLAICCSAGCSGGNDAGNDSAASTTTQSSSASGANLTITGGAYESDLVVDPGATVTVHNADVVAHNVVAEDGSFRSPNIPPDGEGTFTAPSQPGRYEFTCTLQPGMRAALTVRGETAPSTPEPTGATPSGPPPGQSTPSAPGPTTSVPGRSAPGSSAPGSPAPGSSTPGGY